MDSAKTLGKPAKLIATLAIFMVAAISPYAAAAQSDGVKSSNGAWAFAESFSIIAREGIEAILVIAALIAYLSRSGHKDKTRLIYQGAIAAIGASVFTAAIINAAFGAGDGPKEILEGITLLLAAATMLYVTNWFLGKLEGKKWANYIKARAGDALGKNSYVALFAVAFLAVYREGFETVLFYKALAISTGDTSGIIAGIAAGIAFLAAAYLIIIKIENWLPLNAIFAATSAMLFILAFKFVGKGIHELQEAGIVAETKIAAFPHIADIGVYPTHETIIAQSAVAMAGVLLVWAHFLRKTGKSQATIPGNSGNRKQ